MKINIVTTTKYCHHCMKILSWPLNVVTTPKHLVTQASMSVLEGCPRLWFGVGLCALCGNIVSTTLCGNIVSTTWKYCHVKILSPPLNVVKATKYCQVGLCFGKETRLPKDLVWSWTFCGNIVSTTLCGNIVSTT